MNSEKLVKYIDHTLLKQDAGCDAIKKLCDEAVQYGFYSVCVQPCWTALAKSCLIGTDVKVAVVVGFPMGTNEPEIKALEARLAVERGADEIDMVINVSDALHGNLDRVEDEIRAVKQASQDATLKVIIETSFLSPELIVEVSKRCVSAGAEFVKTSTGFFGAGASVDNVALIKSTVNGKALVKASGGIRDLATALAMIEAGADRLGVSAGVKIIEEARVNECKKA